MYTIIDLLEKLIVIEKNSEEGYLILASNEDINERVRILARVFAKKHGRHSERYKEMKSKINGNKEIEIDFFTYDKAAKLIYEFISLKKSNLHCTRTKDVLDIALKFQKEQLSLVLSIRGLLVKSQADIGTENYKILTSIIEEEKQHIKDLENLRNKAIEK
ncbi:hypothetical protein CSC2_15630 [Clostridium zeae]|uniref:DUF2383 domain-containing protein n=1 Tax=Clostridium zeae TaxID=2759022 RepID=A0ABQ1E8C5_9CLOT|nr:hypothetical protein [Clostridium zeae]GFZ31037.1 hypothetical protein CSC2_15630 [Clostridium zeae]